MTFIAWLQHVEPMLPMAAAILGGAILAGCAAASCFCPSEKKDCLFHRHVV